MTETIRLAQLVHPHSGRSLALVEEPYLNVLNGYASVYQLAITAMESKTDIGALISDARSNNKLLYDSLYEGQSSWTLLPSFDCPGHPSNCIVSGTGLTHKNSALNRQMMHGDAETLTDSMRMYQWGLEGGQPDRGKIGVQPEWFYKGSGAILKGHGQPLQVPSFANDGGEEPEIAGVYIIDKTGQPFRIGFTTGNEFSDHVMERKNYLYLAPSKLRSCAIGPELVIDADFADIEGQVQVLRDKETLWSAAIRTGEKNMAHSLANLEYHHFKYPDHRLPLQGHVHFFGADAFSFGAGISLQTGDQMFVHWEGLGRPLINPLMVNDQEEKAIEIKTLRNF